ncbi:GNAT family N-acetyltransferase [Paenibacillus sp. QZ-Y1]|uniref:GNAT family N-acetyltransferase n=1 Tax=Paenibacillus sp. QZ-Y1 TaxID=3414511 RepID=UPI003F79E98F
MEYRIRSASLDDVNEVARLFNEYRMFYNQSTDIQAASQYIRERIKRNESVILIAEAEQDISQPYDGSFGDRQVTRNLAGFVQIYPSFSSVSMRPIWVLNDLYVDSEQRHRGVARKLLRAARQMGYESGVLRISLSTAVSNKKAQSLYESEGYVQDTDFMYYELHV